MKRLISLIVSLALLTVVLTGCTGGPADSRVATAPEAAEKMAWPRTSEGIAAMNPDYIFLFGAIESKASGYKQRYLLGETQASPVWQSLAAVKNGMFITWTQRYGQPAP